MPADDVQAFMSALRSFVRACQQDQVDDRYELFCRAIETVFQLRSNEGKRGFATNLAAALCLTTSEKREERFRAHYQRRSDIVHGNRFLEAQRDGRAIAAMEIMSRRLMRRVLLDHELQRALIVHHGERRAERERQSSP